MQQSMDDNARKCLHRGSVTGTFAGNRTMAMEKVSLLAVLFQSRGTDSRAHWKLEKQSWYASCGDGAI